MRKVEQERQEDKKRKQTDADKKGKEINSQIPRVKQPHNRTPKDLYFPTRNTPKRTYEYKKVQGRPC